MPLKQRRYSLKSKDAKLILKEISERLKLNVEGLVGSKANLEVVEVGFWQIYLVGGKPLFFKHEAGVLPTLLFHDLAAKAPKVVVDMGAVPYVCKGADVMAPGIVRIEGEFSKGELVLVVDEKYGKLLALGESLYNSETARNTKQSVIVKNFHFVSDKIWKVVKTLTD